MNNIKKIRKTLNLSVTELANRVGMSQSNLTKIENNQLELKDEIAEKISKALNISKTAIYERISNKYNTELELINPEVINLTPQTHLSIPSYMIADNNDYSLYIINNDTMTPTITQKSLAVINNKQKSYTQNGVYLISIKEETFIARLQKTTENSINIIYDNKLYLPETKSIEEIKIKGRVESIISSTKI